jgi:hypothetical protein
VTEDKLAEALAELAVAAYRGKPPARVLKALGTIVALATKGRAEAPSEAPSKEEAPSEAPSKKRARATTKRNSLNGHLGNGAAAPD